MSSSLVLQLKLKCLLKKPAHDGIIEAKEFHDQNKPYGLLSDPTSMILYLCKSD